jgi:hypothetical protein
VGSIVVWERNLGAWRRTVRGRTVLVEHWLAPGTTGAERAAVAAAVDRLAAFLDRSLETVTP